MPVGYCAPEGGLYEESTEDSHVETWQGRLSLCVFLGDVLSVHLQQEPEIKYTWLQSRKVIILLMCSFENCSCVQWKVNFCKES